ncbi:MAG TPA: hypothetical protein VGE24_12055 [Emticicia sp.]
MKTNLILTIGLMSTCTAFSQANDTLKNRSEKPNELGINVAPVIRNLLLNGSVPVNRFSLSYKRYLNERSGLRFIGVVDLVNKDMPGYSSYSEKIFLQDDSILIKQKRITPVYVSPRLNLGYERLFGKRKLKWFYGADVSVGYAVSKSMLQNFTMQKDTSSGQNYFKDQPVHGETISSTRTRILSFWFSPFFGVKYPLSKRFSVSAQVGVDFVFSDERSVENAAGLKKESNSKAIDFNQNSGFLNDVSLIYKF